MESAFNFIFLVIVLFLPAWLGGGYLLYRCFLFLFKKSFLCKKNKKIPKMEKNGEKILFYNLWFPLVIGGFFSVMPIIFGISKITIFGIWPILLSSIGTTPFFWIFYFLYHLVYWLFTKLLGGKYYGGVISRYVFFISLIIMLLWLLIMSKGVRL